MRLLLTKQLKNLYRAPRPISSVEALADGLALSTLDALSDIGRNFRNMRGCRSTRYLGRHETRPCLYIYRRVARLIATWVALMAILFSSVACARTDVENKQLVAAKQLYAIVQHGDLSDAAFVTKTLSLRGKNGNVDAYEPDGSPSLLRSRSLSYYLWGPSTGATRAAHLSIMGSDLCIEHWALREVFGQKNRMYRSTTKAEQEKEMGLLYKYEFDAQTIIANFIFFVESAMYAIRANPTIDQGITCH